VLLRGAPGARATAAGRTGEDDVEQARLHELVEVVRRQRPTDPDRPSSLVASDRAPLSNDVVVETAPARVAERAERGDVAQRIGVACRAHSLNIASLDFRRWELYNKHTLAIQKEVRNGRSAGHPISD